MNELFYNKDITEKDEEFYLYCSNKSITQYKKFYHENVFKENCKWINK